MSELVRFSISLDQELVDQFDKHLLEKGAPTRSKALGDLIRKELVKKEWADGKEVAGSVTLVFDHHKRDLVQRLTAVQHDYHDLIIASQHVHLDHDNCLEIVVLKGLPSRVEALGNALESVKGVKHVALTMATTGKHV